MHNIMPYNDKRYIGERYFLTSSECQKFIDDGGHTIRKFRDLGSIYLVVICRTVYDSYE